MAISRMHTKYSDKISQNSILFCVYGVKARTSEEMHLCMQLMCRFKCCSQLACTLNSQKYAHLCSFCFSSVLRYKMNGLIIISAKFHHQNQCDKNIHFQTETSEQKYNISAPPRRWPSNSVMKCRPCFDKQKHN